MYRYFSSREFYDDARAVDVVAVVLAVSRRTESCIVAECAVFLCGGDYGGVIGFRLLGVVLGWDLYGIYFGFVGIG